MRVLYWLEHPAEAREQAVRGRAFVERYDYQTVAGEELTALEDGVKRRANRRR
jgi:hypothetical protein